LRRKIPPNRATIFGTRRWGVFIEDVRGGGGVKKWLVQGGTGESFKEKKKTKRGWGGARVSLWLFYITGNLGKKGRGKQNEKEVGGGV